MLDRARRLGVTRARRVDEAADLLVAHDLPFSTKLAGLDRDVRSALVLGIAARRARAIVGDVTNASDPIDRFERLMKRTRGHPEISSALLDESVAAIATSKSAAHVGMEVDFSH